MMTHFDSWNPGLLSKSVEIKQHPYPLWHRTKGDRDAALRISKSKNSLKKPIQSLAQSQISTAAAEIAD